MHHDGSWASAICKQLRIAEQMLQAPGDRDRHAVSESRLDLQESAHHHLEQAIFEEPPDAALPYVMMGGGQPKGLSTLEQIRLMEITPHPDELAFGQLEPDLQEAV